MIRKMTSDHLLFDLDGTLIDPKVGISRCVLYAFDQMGHPRPSDVVINNMIGPSIKESFSKIFGADQNDCISNAIQLYRERYATHGIYENTLYEGILPTLVELRKRYRSICIATAKPEIFAIQILKELKIDHLFDSISGSELDGQRTDKRHLIEYMMQKFKIPNNSIVIGDRQYDMVAAKTHNMHAIGVTWGYGTAEELISTGADTLAHSPSELLNLLLK